MPEKFTPPAFGERTFNCPHCGALCQQYWFTAYVPDRSEAIHLVTDEVVTHLKSLFNAASDQEGKKIQGKLVIAEEALKGYFFRAESGSQWGRRLQNLFLSECYGCGQIAIWRRDTVIFPMQRHPVEPNADMPKEIKLDFEEARTIVQVSPRGAAALLRLCIQKLCNHLLGEPYDINTAIGELVKQGLRIEIQQALDTVRVIGNESVHPGQIDLRDEPETAQSLFDLVNFIVEDRISQPKKVLEIYSKLPALKVAGIKQRDRPVAGKVTNKP